MGTSMTLYAVTFSCFPIGFQEFLHKHLLYLQIFSTRFFKDYIHSSRRSSAQGKCYNTESYDHLRQEPGTATTPVTAIAVGTRHPPSPGRTTASSTEPPILTCIKRMKE
jgi:hypothetical protein